MPQIPGRQDVISVQLSPPHIHTLVPTLCCMRSPSTQAQRLGVSFLDTFGRCLVLGFGIISRSIPVFVRKCNGSHLHNGDPQRTQYWLQSEQK
eukprot:6134058-Amphidinium_carterae.1